MNELFFPAKSLAPAPGNALVEPFRESTYAVWALRRVELHRRCMSADLRLPFSVELPFVLLPQPLVVLEHIRWSSEFAMLTPLHALSGSLGIVVTRPLAVRAVFCIERELTPLFSMFF